MLVKNNGSDFMGTEAQSRLSVRPQDVYKVVALMIQKYQLRTTPIREVVINGLEATDNAVRQGRKFRPVEIGLNADIGSDPSPFARAGDIDVRYDNAVVTITDHGEGMSPDFMTNMFTSLTASTKDNDKDAIGGLGIGSKSILSLTDYATWRTVKDGMATVMVISTDNKSGFAINHESYPTDDDNGTTVTVPVSSDIMTQIIKSLSSDFLDYIPAHRVTVTGNLADGVTVGNVIDRVAHTTSNGTGFIRSNSPDDNRGIVHLMVNGAPYPTPEEVANINHVRAKVNKGTDDAILTFDEVVVNLDQNHEAVMILGSREALVENEKLNDLIRNTVREAVEEMINVHIDKISAASNTEEFLDAIHDCVSEELVSFCEVYAPFRGYYRVPTPVVDGYMNVLAGVGNTTHRRHTYPYNSGIVDMVNGAFVSLRDVMDSTDHMVFGASDIKEPADDYGRVNNMSPWQKEANKALMVSTTDNIAKAFTNAKSITDIVGDDTKIRYICANSHIIKESVNEVVRFFNDLGVVFENFPGDLEDNLIEDIDNRITVSPHSADDVREMIKKYARKVASANRSAPRRRTREERIKEAPIHVLSFTDGVGFEVEDFFPTVPKLNEWLDKNNACWVAMTSDYTYSREYGRLDSKTLDEKKIISESVPDKNLRVVLIRKDTLITRVVNLNAGQRMVTPYCSVLEFLDRAVERASIYSAGETGGLDISCINNIIDGVSYLLDNIDDKAPLMERLIKEFKIKDDYREVVANIMETTESANNYWNRNEAGLIRRHLPDVSIVFEEGELMNMVKSFPDEVLNRSDSDITADPVTILRRSVDMVSSL